MTKKSKFGEQIIFGENPVMAKHVVMVFALLFRRLPVTLVEAVVVLSTLQSETMKCDKGTRQLANPPVIMSDVSRLFISLGPSLSIAF